MRTSSPALGRPRRSARGITLIEILVAMGMVAIVMVGILQTFALALSQSHSSATRTQLTFKCQQVVEIIRLSQYLVGPSVNPVVPSFAQAYKIGDTTTGIIKAGTFNLPYVKTDAALGWAAWGPSGANVVEQENDAYQLSYTVEAATAPLTGFRIRVTALPHVDPTSGPKTSAALLYRGKALNLKRVDYVAYLP